MSDLAQDVIFFEEEYDGDMLEVLESTYGESAHSLIVVLAREVMWLRAENEMLRKLDQGAAKVEEIICLRSQTFTGEPPYVGWEGLAKALTEDYNELQILKEVVKEGSR